jgi:hypothetical protein
MKKKLLITLGCSFTEGVGCYNPTLLDETGTPIDSESVYNSSLERFHTLGWPAKLQKKLQYDCLWNLGRGAASNSENVKRWFEIFSTESITDEYDVLVIWLVTFSGRISFYKEGKIRSILPTNNLTDLTYIFYNSYISFLESGANKNTNTDRDMILEASFYLNVISTICKLSNYKFLYINCSNTEGEQLDTLVQSPHSLNSTYKRLYPNHNSVLDRDGSKQNTSFCGHPNEHGYEIIAERFFNMISHEHKHLINTNTPTTYKMRYLGEPTQW